MSRRVTIGLAWVLMVVVSGAWRAEAGPAWTLLVTNSSDDTVRRLDATTGADLGVFASGGPLSFPIGFDFGPDGNLYVAGYSSGDVVRYDGQTGAFLDEFVAGGPTRYDATFGPDGNLYVTNHFQGEVAAYDGATGVPMGTFASGMAWVDQIEFHGGYLYASTGDADQIFRFDAVTGAFVDEFVPAGSGGLNNAMGFTWGPDGNFYVIGQDSQAVHVYDGSTGAPIGSGIFATTALNAPRFLAFSPVDGNLYVTDNDGIEIFDGTTGAWLGSWQDGLNNPRDLMFVPEPSSALLLVGCAGLLAIGRRRAR